MPKTQPMIQKDKQKYEVWEHMEVYCFIEKLYKLEREE